MTIREAAQRLGKSESALRRAIKAKRLDATLVKSKYDITEEALYAYAPDRHKVGAPTRDTEEMERQRVENETLRRELENTGLKLEERDNQIAELQSDIRGQMAAIQDRDKRITELNHVVAVAQNTAQELIYQLKTPFWKRWFRRQRALPAPDGVMDMEAEDENRS